MRARSLRHIVDIQQIEKTADGIGGFSEEWVDLYAGTRAAIWPKKMVETNEAGKVTATITHQIRIRYASGIDELCRVLFGTREFEIISILDPEERHEILDLMCEEKR